MRGALRTLLVLVALALVGASCGDDDSDAPSTAGDAGGNGTAASADCGGTLNVGTYTEPRGLDPLDAAGATTAGLEVAALYDPLVRWNPEEGVYEPWLAESFETTDDGRTWTITVRDGAVFGNGDPITAEAVARSIERHQPQENASLQRVLALLIERIDVVDERTLTIMLHEAWPGFPFVLAGPVGQIVNIEVAQQRGADFKTNPAGAESGPFAFSRLAPGEEIVLTAREDYWGGKPCVDAVRFIRLMGAAATYEALRAGQLDVGLLRDPKVIADARADDSIEVFASLANGGEVILMNNGVRGSSSPTTDVRVRRAIVAAIDVDEVNQRASQGTALATKALIHPEASIWSQGLEGPEHDPELARRLVAEAKADGWDGKIRLRCDNAPNRVDIGNAVATQLEAVGIDVELDTSQPIGATIQAVVTDANYDLACWGINVFDDSPWAKLNRQLGGSSPSNFAGFVNTEWDAALHELRMASDRDETLAALKRLQEIANEQAPLAVLSSAEEVVAWRDGVSGLVPTSEANVLLADVVKAG
ncbi:MAG TPA: ABC transporter substrate-binding protein [Acidimicrobiales bacterium]